LGGSVFAIKTNTEALVIASKEIDLEGNAENYVYFHVSSAKCRKKSRHNDTN